MPSLFTHLVFAEEAVVGALGDAGRDLLATHGCLLRFAAQGPDFFYHNQRTMPTGLRYGVALHRRGFGAFVGELVREAQRLHLGVGSELGAFTLGFATHAVLDRRTHPYIVYRSGWVDPQKPETRRLRFCHPFLERILDVLVLQERRQLSPGDFDFLPLVRGRGLPYVVLKAFVKGLHAVYPTMTRKSLDRRRIENAYHDTMFFYKLTNHRNPDIHRLAYRKDQRDGFQERRMALLHPREVPAGIDFLNRAGAPWRHPCAPDEASRAGFLELYEEALAESVTMTRRLAEALAGHASPAEAARAVGDQSLDTAREPCTPVVSDPFPLPEILDGLYREMEAASAGR